MHVHRLPRIAGVRQALCEPGNWRVIGGSAASPPESFPWHNRWFLEGDGNRHASGFCLVSLPLNGAKLMFKSSARTLFGVFATIPNSFGPPATQLAMAAICVGTMVLALIGGLHHSQLEPVKIRSEDAKR